MNKLTSLIFSALSSLLCSIIAVHYLEVQMLPLVERVRIFAYGDQSYSGALKGCAGLKESGVWVHPATLSLSVYGDAQKIFLEKFGKNGEEVLPNYAMQIKGRQELVCVADYLMTVAEVTIVDGVSLRKFEYDIPESTYGLQRGWVSGLAQGMVGQVFLAAYLATGEEKYFEAARETGRLLSMPIERGGVLKRLSEKEYWYEEYAQLGSEAPLVLNGHLLALDYLHWMSIMDPEEKWRGLFDNGMNAVVSRIDGFVSSNWSYYDLQAHLVTGKYHRFHIRQLKRYEIYDKTGSLQRARKVMERQLMMPLGIFQRLITQPSRLLIFQIMLIFALLFPAVLIIKKTGRQRDSIWGALWRK